MEDNCPCFLRPVAPTELPTEVHVEAAETAASSSTVEAAALSEHEQRAFKRAARRLNLRLCPSCNAPVQKNGGCSHMTCRCGAHFEWSSAKPVNKAFRYRTYRYARMGTAKLKKGAEVVGTAVVVVVAVPVAVAGAAAGAAVVAAGGLIYMSGGLALLLIFGGGA